MLKLTSSSARIRPNCLVNDIASTAKLNSFDLLIIERERNYYLSFNIICLALQDNPETFSALPCPYQSTQHAQL